ncbi:MAG: translocation/assembly module TamB domain-containing protein, partial [Gammaproteobacteria bacterium]
VTLKTEEASADIELGASSLSGEINGEIVSAGLNLALAAQDYLRARLQLDTGTAQALSGQITASVVEFAMLNPFVPQLTNIKGTLKADLTLSGSLDTPTANGTIHFTGGAADQTGLGIQLREIKLQALAAAERIQLSGSAKSGQGSISLDGFADLQGTAELNLNGTDFEVAKLPEAQIAVSPELKLLFADKQGKVTGKLKIPKAILQLQEIPESAVKVSSDEVIVGEQKVEKPAAAAINIDADIEVELGKQVSFSGQGLQTKLSGKLKVTMEGKKTAMFGVVDMDKAQYKRYGQELTVRKGRFLFSGPVDKPWLDLEAIRVSKSRDVTAILSLTGPLEAPQARIYSEPALPEAEALAYLVTGGALNQVSKAESNMVAGAALSYGAGQVSWIADKLGVEEFEIKEGKTLQDTLASVGKYLTPDFYAGAKVGLFNKQAVLVLKRKLTQTLNVETQTGTSQRIKLNYEFDSE